MGTELMYMGPSKSAYSNGDRHGSVSKEYGSSGGSRYMVRAPQRQPIGRRAESIVAVGAGAWLDG